MKLLFGGAAMRRSLRSAIGSAAPAHELRMLAPDAEAKALRDRGVPTESLAAGGYVQRPACAQCLAPG